MGEVTSRRIGIVYYHHDKAFGVDRKRFHLSSLTLDDETTASALERGRSVTSLAGGGFKLLQAPAGHSDSSAIPIFR
jgi:hypothetical protein